MIFILLTIILSVYIIYERNKIRAIIRDAETIEAHYPDGSFTYLSERDFL